MITQEGVKAINNEETKADSSVDCSSSVLNTCFRTVWGKLYIFGTKDVSNAWERGDLSRWAEAMKRSGGSELQRRDYEVWLWPVITLCASWWESSSSIAALLSLPFLISWFRFCRNSFSIMCFHLLTLCGVYLFYPSRPHQCWTLSGGTQR